MDEVREGAILRQSIHATSSTWRILCILRWGYLSGSELADLLPLELFSIILTQKYGRIVFRSKTNLWWFQKTDTKANICHVWFVANILSLTANVVEDVRAHRIVYGKSLSFGWFADLEPNGDSIIIKIQKDRKETFQTKIITSEQELDALKSEISDAYSTIH